MADKSPQQQQEETQEARLAALEQQVVELKRAHERQQRIHIQEQANLMDGIAQACRAQATQLRDRLPMETILRKVPEEEAANQGTAVLIMTGDEFKAFGIHNGEQTFNAIDISGLDRETIEAFFFRHADSDANGATVMCNIYKQPIII